MRIPAIVALCLLVSTANGSANTVNARGAIISLCEQVAVKSIVAAAGDAASCSKRDLTALGDVSWAAADIQCCGSEPQSCLPFMRSTLETCAERAYSRAWSEVAVDCP